MIVRSELRYDENILFTVDSRQSEPRFIGEKKELIDRLSDTELLARFLLDSLL